jgi:hypothetical protein
MAAAWVPILCYDAAAAKEALLTNTTLARLGGSGEFLWYLDRNFTKSVSQDSLSSLEGEIGYTTSKFHVAHCLYVWRLGLIAMHRLMEGERGVYVHFRVVDKEHTMHCNKIISNEGIPRDAIAAVYFKVGYCRRLDNIV